MNLEDLINTLNQYPMWTQVEELDESERSALFKAIAELSELFESAASDLRKVIASTLNRRAKYMMYQYTWLKATEARRTGSRAAILQGLIPVIMGGGAADRPTAGGLLAVLLRAGEATGQDVSDLFSYAGGLSPDQQIGAQIQSFPSETPEMRGIQRFGFREIKTPAGIVYETPQDRMSRPTWWERLRGRRPVSRKESLATMRALEAQHPEWTDPK